VSERTLHRSAPLHFRSDTVSYQSGDLARLSVPAECRLREDQHVIQGDLESTLRRGDQLDRRDDWCPAGEQFVRQTDGARDIVSGDAELDAEMMPRVEHVRPTLAVVAVRSRSTRSALWWASLK
jgi:hypothetical protein